MKGTVITTAKLTITTSNDNYDLTKLDLSIMKSEENKERVRDMLKEILGNELDVTREGWAQTVSISDVNVEIIEEQNDN